ncbi:hypothetical protein [Actinomadura madurae]|uniref:hypothetical protein n=1 Tax=Actinomadura madurae TaxID=1993 RepID=UPI002025DFE4|nr:hypothetical protein [Actinomadura madurae]MCP9947019.1 hypothetical protein [Actinomadura madurae]MCP9963788.1 hypothetical protein [Actinomadura madurae]MCP9976266.1 hypothetical protein [Actinomadura madurae]MCQ0012245.1 hypothetical protein [Actinomadura madurae]MCQ0012453.1 hypothetical protein [Actinomadura madurae]
MKRAHRVRQLVNAVNLSTGLGLLLAATTARGAGFRRGPDGLIVAGGYRLPVPVASAFTVGNVILLRGDASRLSDTSRLLRHEGRHSTQYAWCLGVAMIPLYGACAGVSMLLCGDWASYNPFERLAGLADGGYERRPLRPLLRRS